MTARPQAVTRQGNYAGAVSRLLAFAADVAIAWFSLLIILWLASMAVSLVIPSDISIKQEYRWVAAASIAVWFPLYFAYQWSLSGKTLGMAIFGLRVVTSEGAPISNRAAVIRTITLPISILLAIFGLAGIILRPDHRAWHDRFAKTCVVYDWDARAARLLWLAKQHEQVGGQRRSLPDNRG